MIKFNIAKEYTDTPGGRYIKEGKYSGEEFREKILVSLVEQAKEQNEKVLINLDGCFGYPSSFLDEAFGGIARLYGSKYILSVLEFVCQDQPGLETIIKGYIEAAGEK